MQRPGGSCLADRLGGRDVPASRLPGIDFWAWECSQKWMTGILMLFGENPYHHKDPGVGMRPQWVKDPH